MTTVREALEKNVYVRTCGHSTRWDDTCTGCRRWLARRELVETLAPKVEAALRAAYWAGERCSRLGEKNYSDLGVTAGVEELCISEKR